jgi:acyl-CoA thioester hydrolase
VSLCHRTAPFLPSATDLTVRFADVDMMKVVHHAAYIHWFEQIRFAFLERLMGIDIKRLSEEQMSFPLVECHVNYRRAVTFGEKPVGYSQVQIHRKAAFTFFYSIYTGSHSDKACAVGRTTHCYVGAGMQLQLAPPPFIVSGFALAHAKYPGCVLPTAE